MLDHAPGATVELGLVRESTMGGTVHLKVEASALPRLFKRWVTGVAHKKPRALRTLQ